MTRTRPRPLIRHERGWWRIYVGRSRHRVGNYYTNAATAADAARNMWKGHR